MNADIQPSGAPKRVAIYPRVSSDEQRERQSIETQIEFLNRYCELNKFTVYKVYKDDGVSGSIPLKERPAGGQMLADARAGKFDLVLVYRVDRLSREYLDAGLMVKELKEMGVGFVSATENFDNTPAGKFLFAVLSAAATHEKESILMRSLEGTERLARKGTWLGGIKPYGYDVEGVDRDARLVVSDDKPIPGTAWTEASVIRLIYRLCAEEKWSCFRIAEHLNALNIPPSYVKDNRIHIEKKDGKGGKRKVKIAGIWRPSRIRNLIVNTTYMGVHFWGRRPKNRKKGRPLIKREVPAIVSKEIWEAAQLVLKGNRRTPTRKARRYLLRGRIKCASCGLRFSGTPLQTKAGIKHIYRCNGRIAYRGLYGKDKKICPSAAVHGLEDMVWADLSEFLRNPGSVLDELVQNSEDKVKSAARISKEEKASMEAALRQKEEEWHRANKAWTEGLFSQEDFNVQRQRILGEKKSIQDRLDAMETELSAAERVRTKLASAKDLLHGLQKQLKGEISWELKRQLVELLVEEVLVKTAGEGKFRKPQVTITYGFDKVADKTRAVIRTDRDSSPPGA